MIQSHFWITFIDEGFPAKYDIFNDEKMMHISFLSFYGMRLPWNCEAVWLFLNNSRSCRASLPPDSSLVRDTSIDVQLMS